MVLIPEGKGGCIRAEIRNLGPKLREAGVAIQGNDTRLAADVADVAGGRMKAECAIEADQKFELLGLVSGGGGGPSATGKRRFFHGSEREI